MPERPLAVLDANVLYPFQLRNLLSATAQRLSARRGAPPLPRHFQRSMSIRLDFTQISWIGHEVQPDKAVPDASTVCFIAEDELSGCICMRQ
jgi:hypothetical protein